jgi:hypothetical protein
MSANTICPDGRKVVWCGQDEPCFHGQTGRYVHDIDADPRDIVAVIDSFVWCHIIKCDSRYIPPEEHNDLRFQAATSGRDYDATLRQAEDDYLAANLPDDLWSAMTKPEVSKKSDQLLLKFPFTFSAIQNVDVVTVEIANSVHRKKRQMTMP